MTAMKDYLRNHKLVWLVPMILVPLILVTLILLARSESAIPDSPFIYDV